MFRYFCMVRRGFPPQIILLNFAAIHTILILIKADCAEQAEIFFAK